MLVYYWWKFEIYFLDFFLYLKNMRNAIRIFFIDCFFNFYNLQVQEKQGFVKFTVDFVCNKFRVNSILFIFQILCQKSNFKK